MMSSRFLRAGSRTLRNLPVRATTSIPMRQFQTSHIRAAAAGANAVQPEEEKGIIETYGYMPFFGLGAAALVGKEMYILDAESMLAVNTLGFVFTAWVAVGDGFAKSVEEHNTLALEKYNKALDAVMVALTSYKTTVNSKFTEVEVMKEFIEEQHSAAVQMVAYENAKVRHAAYDAMMTKLSGIEAREAAEAAEELTLLVDYCVGTVEESFTTEGKGADKLKAEALQFAIDNIGKAPPANDPVSKLFQQVITDGEKQATE